MKKSMSEHGQSFLKIFVPVAVVLLVLLTLMNGLLGIFGSIKSSIVWGLIISGLIYGSLFYLDKKTAESDDKSGATD